MKKWKHNVQDFVKETHTKKGQILTLKDDLLAIILSKEDPYIGKKKTSSKNEQCGFFVDLPAPLRLEWPSSIIISM